MDARSSEGEPDSPTGEERPRRSNRKRRQPEKYLPGGDEEIQLTDEQGIEPNDEEEFKPDEEEFESSEEDKKPLRKKKKKAEARRLEPAPAPAPAVEVVRGDDPAPVLPEDFDARRRELRGTVPILVVQKKLFKTDVEKNQNRLSIPANQMKQEFLTPGEETRLLDGMAVKMIEPSLQESEIMFKKHKIKKNYYLYVLMTQWNSVVTRNGLEKEDTVQIWSFRVDSVLWLALVKVPAE